MNHLIHAHDVTKRVTRIGEPISGTYKTIKGGIIHTSEYTPSQSSAGFTGTDTIFSQFDEGGNSIHTYYNGVIFYIVKQITGQPTEYVTLPFTVIADNTYAVLTEIKANWTCQLTVNGVAALAGFGAELMINGNFSSSAGWTAQAGWTIDTTAGVANVNTAASDVLLYRTIGSTYLKKVLQLSWDTKSAAGTGYRPFFATIQGATLNALGVRVYTAIVPSGVNFGVVAYNVVGQVDDISLKEIYNSTTTQAPVYRGHLGG